MMAISPSRIAKGGGYRWTVDGDFLRGDAWGLGGDRIGTAGIAVGGVRPQLGRRGRFCWRARVRCGRVHGKLSMPAMMLPFAERSASGHPPCGWGVSGALINEGALTWGPDGSGRLEGAGGVGGLLMLEEKPGSMTGVLVGAYYPLYDGNGNITQLLDAPGGVAAHYDYDAFGNVTAATGPAARKKSSGCRKNHTTWNC